MWGRREYLPVSVFIDINYLSAFVTVTVIITPQLLNQLLEAVP